MDAYLYRVQQASEPARHPALNECDGGSAVSAIQMAWQACHIAGNCLWYNATSLTRTIRACARPYYGWQSPRGGIRLAPLVETDYPAVDVA